MIHLNVHYTISANNCTNFDDFFSFRLNNAIERNVLLENELVEKDQLMVTVQRLKDESKELKQELSITTKHRQKKNGQGYDGSQSNEVKDKDSNSAESLNQESSFPYGLDCKINSYHNVFKMSSGKNCGQEMNDIKSGIKKEHSNGNNNCDKNNNNNNNNNNNKNNNNNNDNDYNSNNNNNKQQQHQQQ